MDGLNRKRLCDLDPELSSLTSQEESRVLSILEDRDKIIRLQQQQIERLVAKVGRLKADKDLLKEQVELTSVNSLEAAGVGNEPGNTSVTSVSSTGRCVSSQRTTSPSAGLPDSSPSSRAGSFKLSSPSGSLHGQRVQRQRSFKNNDEAVKRSRPHASSYQLSQDLRDKQVEMLERKYGGSIRSRRAARTIQRAFRQYCLNKNFQKLRNSYGERRLSKRLSEVGRIGSIWSESLGGPASADDNFTTGTASNLEDSLDRGVGNMVNAVRPTDRYLNQYADRENGTSYLPGLSQAQRMEVWRTSGRYQESGDRVAGRDSNYNTCPSPVTHPDGIYAGSRNSRSKSASISSYDSSHGGYPGVDLDRSQDRGGGFGRMGGTERSDFQSLLEEKDTNFLTDSFHNEDMTNSNYYPGFSKRPSSSSLRSTNLDYPPEMVRMSPSPAGSYNNFRTVAQDSSDYLSDTRHSASQVGIESVSSGENSPVYTKEEIAAAQMKFLMATSPGRLDPAQAATVRTSDTSPIWKRKGTSQDDIQQPATDRKGDLKRMSNISETSEAESMDGVNSSSLSSENASTENISLCSRNSQNSLGYQGQTRLSITPDSQSLPRSTDKYRKRVYRIGLNLFNKKPEKGLRFLLDHMFLDSSPKSVARFFISRKGLSKQMIGEFLGNLQSPFNQEVLQYFCDEIDLSGLQVDVALRKFQCFFRMPGEAQKIERLMEAFADRYCQCNPDQVKNFKSPDTIFLLAFAIIMLNTDLHNTSVKAERKMKLEDFLKNMRGIDAGEDIDRDLLIGIYERVRSQEFKAGVDQVTQVMKVEQTIIGKKPILALPHRRLVCYCRLYEVHDPNRKEKIGLHQREVFLFNDLLLITKIFSKKKTGITYSFRTSLPLSGMRVLLFETTHYQYGIQLLNGIDIKPLVVFNARNDHDRQKFIDDLKESILETNGMEELRINEEMAKHGTTHNTMDKRYACDDSRVLAYDLAKTSDSLHNNRLSAPECSLKKMPFCNSLTDLSSDAVMKRGSSGASLDSGMASGSISSSSDTYPFSTLPSTPVSLGLQRSNPSLGHLSSKRHPAPRAPIVLRPGLPDGTQV